MNVKLIRMWSGEDVVADLIEEKEDSIDKMIDVKLIRLL